MKLRKIKYKSHKCFGIHSIIVKDETTAKWAGRGIGSKKIAASDYPRCSDYRTKAEKIDSKVRKEIEEDLKAI